MSKPGYELLPHMTDAYIQATGKTFEQALESAGLALFDVMCNTESISHKSTDQVELNGADEITLLYDWLEVLLLKFELDGKVYSKFEVDSIKKSANGFRSRAKISGEKYDRKKHGSKVEVKAVTFHRMEVDRAKTGTNVRFILDL